MLTRADPNAQLPPAFFHEGCLLVNTLLRFAFPLNNISWKPLIWAIETHPNTREPCAPGTSLPCWGLANAKDNAGHLHRLSRTWSQENALVTAKSTSCDFDHSLRTKIAKERSPSIFSPEKYVFVYLLFPKHLLSTCVVRGLAGCCRKGRQDRLGLHSLVGL